MNPIPGQTDKRSIGYVKALATTFGVGDNSELFRIEAGLLKELAQLDDAIDKYKATQAQVGYIQIDRDRDRDKDRDRDTV